MGGGWGVGGWHAKYRSHEGWMGRGGAGAVGGWQAKCHEDEREFMVREMVCRYLRTHAREG